MFEEQNLEQAVEETLETVVETTIEEASVEAPSAPAETVAEINCKNRYKIENEPKM